MAKPNASPPAPLSNPGTEKRTRRPALPLSDRAAEIIRQTAKYIGQPQDDVKISVAVAGIPDGTAAVRSLDELIETMCRAMTIGYDKARESARESIFTKPLNPEAVERPINQRPEGEG